MTSEYPLGFRRLVLALGVMAGLLAIHASLRAEPVSGEMFPLRQPDGTRLEVRVWGDEFYRVVESMDGYTLVQDPTTGFACYAELSAGSDDLVSTGIPAGSAAPEEQGLIRHLRINPVSARAKISAARARAAQGEAEMLKTLELRGGARQEPACLGDVQGIVLLVDFSDEPGTIPPSNVDNYCNQAGYTGYGNNGSVRDYFYDVSDGFLTYTNFVPTAYYRAAHPKTYYEDPEVPYGLRAQELVYEALVDLDSQGFDFSEYDSNGDGIIDGINCFYAGYRGSVWAEGLWPHSWVVDFYADGVWSYKYQITDLQESLALRTFCHENGHMICYWPDLYDYDLPGPDDSAGVGQFCIMCSSTSSTNPQEPCAYMKYISGWSTTAILTVAQSGLAVPAGVNTLYKFEHPTLANEYYLIENRQQTGRDGGLPDAGLAIWHVDEYGSNDWEDMTPEYHYLVTLVQADGNWDLEHNVNYGDSTDLWSAPDYTECSPGTSPNTNWWDGSSSGLFVGNISALGQVMTFSYHNAADCNNNGVPDYQDIAGGTSTDNNGNGIPDECECAFIAGTPQPASPVVAKGRYVTIVPGNPGEQTALRVRLADLPPPFESAQGHVMWVGSPQDISEDPGSSGTGPPTFKGAVLSCDPVYADFGAIGLLHVYSDAIVPGAVYEVQAISQACFAGAEANYSEALAVATSAWGDTVGGGNQQPPQGTVDFTDISSVVDKFKNLPGAPAKARVDVAPDTPDRIIDFNDIPAVVEAFRGLPYPYGGPHVCP